MLSKHAYEQAIMTLYDAGDNIEASQTEFGFHAKFAKARPTAAGGGSLLELFGSNAAESMAENHLDEARSVSEKLRHTFAPDLCGVPWSWGTATYQIYGNDDETDSFGLAPFGAGKLFGAALAHDTRRVRRLWLGL